MRLAATLNLYLARHMLSAIATTFLVLAVVLFMFDIVELSRRMSGRDNSDFGVVVRMALLHLPYLMQRAAPYAILIGGLLCFARLTARNEIVALRSAGVSTPQILFPGVVVAVLIGGFAVALFSPFSSAMLAGYSALDNEYLRDRTHNVAIPRNGLWLRQSDSEGMSIIHAAGVDRAGAGLRDILIIRYRGQDRFIERIDAAGAVPQDGHWLLRDALITGPEHRSQSVETYRFATDLTLDRIQESFAAPETQSFWDIPDFIASLDRAGFSSLSHRLHWHSMAASPLFFAGMILIAALFSLRFARPGRAGGMLVLGGVCGFAFYILSDVVMAYGLNGQVPYMLAAWAPAAVAVLFGSALLLHVRQG